MRQIFYNFYLLISRFYSFLFSKKYLQNLNNVFFNLTIKAKGYSNYGSLYETGELSFIKLISKFNPKLSIDVGANVGNFSKILLQYTNTKVVAFEPLPEAFKILKGISDKNNNRFFPYNYGLGKKRSKSKLFYNNKYSQLATYNKNYSKVTFFNNDKPKKIVTNISSLDQFYYQNKNFFLENGLDFIKIDVEGNEYNVLEGAKNTINKFQPNFIQIEINSYNIFSNHSLNFISKALPNYKIFQILPYDSGLKKVNSDHPVFNLFYLSNFVFINKNFIRLNSKFIKCH
jgi:FkbM family methyltransferase